MVQALRQPGPWWLALGFGCYSLIFYALMVWLPTFLVQERGASVTAAALLTALVVAVNVCGNLLGSWLVHRAAPRGHVISLAFLVMAACACGIFSSALSDSLRSICACSSCSPAYLAGLLARQLAPAQAGLAWATLVRSSMVMAEVISVAMSPMLAGTMRVLLVLAR